MQQPGSEFRRALSERLRGPGSKARTWVYVPYDQLHDGLGTLATLPPEELGIVLVESPEKASRRPYHKQKLALVLANLRHFALEQAARGVDVRHVVAGAEGYRGALEQAARELGPLRVHEPAERELREELRPLVGSALTVHPHTGWLTTREQFTRATGGAPPYRMDAFYRVVRKDTGVLMERGKPVGGKLSFDEDNRKAWRGTPPAPTPPRFVPDAVTEEVGRLVERRYAAHPGELDLGALPATLADAEASWRWALDACLPSFGPYEDAMSRASSGLFHTRVSALLNLHRLLPARIIADVLAADLPLQSREGFVRQVLGWREFVRHVHLATDGFRALPWGPEPQAAPSFLGAAQALPPAFWGNPSGLGCLDHVVADVFREGYSHHITRLMVLGNLATLLDVSPRALTDWFWFAYVDAYDWVVEPNVLAMATFGAGELMTTKPYVAGSAYIHRMSDYCGACAFDPKSTCPITRLYWAFLGRHRAALEGNPRIAMPLRSQAKRTEEERARDARVFEWASETLTRGGVLRPEEVP